MNGQPNRTDGQQVAMTVTTVAIVQELIAIIDRMFMAYSLRLLVSIVGEGKTN